MENYNYFEAVKSDVLDAIREDYEESEIIKRLATDRNELAEKLNDDLWNADSVTGNASGSYTFSTYQAEENIAHNWDVLADACDEFGQDMGEAVKRGAEFCDVTIRCHYLSQAIAEALDDLADEYAKQIDNYTDDEESD